MSNGYAQFMEMALASGDFLEIVIFGDEGQTTRVIDTADYDLEDAHGELWCDLMDTREDDISGEVRRCGKTILSMRKLGNSCS